jgi:hypothetical protein
MKFQITMKDADGPYEGIQDAARLDLSKNSGLSADDIETLMESRVEKIKETTRKFLNFGEYVTLEFDTEAQTCVVIPRP